MQITIRNGKTIVELDHDEAAAVRDDLGDIRASQISAAGDRLHRLLENTTLATGSAR
ncbi:hypothetical protein [Streptomyces sp. WMMC897]|uniref:hypothetical protein n=1 Tax=Streptomyces sp. WMMC897 TaxID=3014782 RepID=UPI0022B6E9C1|nr:hypothetical protein [Streptomyces sp. WMMC897]MCZ7413110.1 hypothetical protein [Streptomyces sp. WMMC897]MCZ7415506.1 hypothetical protein [Streptomyces sp. WMMC897]